MEAAYPVIGLALVIGFCWLGAYRLTPQMRRMFYWRGAALMGLIGYFIWHLRLLRPPLGVIIATLILWSPVLYIYAKHRAREREKQHAENNRIDAAARREREREERKVAA